MMILGIDPGKTGGLALVWVNDVTGELKLHDGCRMPTISVRGKDMVNASHVNDWVFNSTIRHALGRVIIEQVSAMPKQGVTSAFSFGRSTGAIEAVAMILCPRVEWVTPAIWKKAMGLSSDKQASLDAARLAFGNEFTWTKKVDDGIAEAALMVKWYTTHRIINGRGA